MQIFRNVPGTGGKVMQCKVDEGVVIAWQGFEDVEQTLFTHQNFQAAVMLNGFQPRVIKIKRRCLILYITLGCLKNHGAGLAHLVHGFILPTHAVRDSLQAVHPARHVHPPPG